MNNIICLLDISFYKHKVNNIFIFYKDETKTNFKLVENKKLLYTDAMNEFLLPILPIRMEWDSDSKMQSYDVSGIELSLINKINTKSLFSGVFVSGGIDGLAFSFCAEIPKAKNMEKKSFSVKDSEYKTDFIENDRFQILLKPNKSVSIFCWQFSYSGLCFDYKITDNKIKKDWKSNVQWHLEYQDEFLYLEVFIPWNDFGLTEPPTEQDFWEGSFTRIHNTKKGMLFTEFYSTTEKELNFGNIDFSEEITNEKYFSHFLWKVLPKKTK